MSRRKILKNKNTLKPVGIRMPLDVLEKWGQTSEQIQETKAIIIESALHHFLTLSKTEQREIIKNYLTKNL